jgi:uncharacterized protein YecE (DUF72 family)
MIAHTGTSGFSFDAWRGTFYPEGLPAKGFLRHYASQLSTVELNNTFYRMPTSAALQGWRDQVPPTFRFSVKAPRRITHLSRLLNCAETLDLLVERVAVLGDQLACVLFQLPPNMKCDLPRLEAFLDTWAGRAAAAFEFRHPSWFEDPAVLALLERHRVALCIGDPEKDEREAPWVATAPFAYVRLRAPGYDDAALRSWAEKIRALQAVEAFVFFKHEVEGPDYAARLRDML